MRRLSLARRSLRAATSRCSWRALPTLSCSVGGNGRYQSPQLFRPNCLSHAFSSESESVEATVESSGLHEEEITAETKPKMTERVKGAAKTHSFQAETKQLLNIVTNSLYTEREVFLRELLSNASDALEKLRYRMNAGDDLLDTHLPMQIEVFTDKEKGTVIIQDSGIGMDAEEMTSNLGTIARSGSKAFVRQMNEEKAHQPSASERLDDDEFVSGTSSIIGQFGVGFYSVFMVADRVDVYSQPARGSSAADGGHMWTSDGTGEFSLAEASGVSRGSKVVVQLKEKYREEFADGNRVEAIIKKYSSYLLFPIQLNGSLVTSTGAIWSKQPSEVKHWEHSSFFQLIANRYDDPYYTYHSSFDSARLSAHCLVYFPSAHEEKFGAGRLEPGVSLYCRKVLVKKNASEVMPDWLRFAKGVVDSENIPIHISRENMQDSELIRQLQETLMMKCVDFLKRQSQKDRKKYLEWYNEYAGFIKEGVCTDYKNRSRIAKLLRYETNQLEAGDKISFDDYIERCQKKNAEESGDGGENKAKSASKDVEIFYLLAPNRAAALKSPYLEAFEDSGIEVLLCYAQIDEFCMKNLGSYRSHEIVGIESSTAVKASATGSEALGETECRRLCKWLKKAFPKRIEKAEMTERLKSHAAVLVDHQSAAIRTYLKSLGEDVSTPPQRMQINRKHKVIRGLYPLIDSDEARARLIASQMINNAFIAAGVLEDARDVLDDIGHVMELALGYDLDKDQIKMEKQQRLDEQMQEMIAKEKDKMG